MTGFITRSAIVLQLAYSAMLVAVGTAGILSARWELATIFKIDPSSWPGDIQATMLNQYRFLKGLELGAGIFCVAYRADIMAGGRASKVFLVVVATGIAGRAFAWAVDGRPATLFVIFLVLEALTLIAVALHLRLMDVSQ
jgi:Domain of unknown function (DUF4345)